MAVYGVRQLTPAQLRIATGVCDRARTLPDRLRELVQVSKLASHAASDVDAVRGWLFALARDEQQGVRERRSVWESLLEGAE